MIKKLTYIVLLWWFSLPSASSAKSYVSVFKSYQGQTCKVFTVHGQSLQSVDCSLLPQFIDHNSAACQNPLYQNSYALFPWRYKKMFLCNENKNIDLKERSHVRFAIIGDVGQGENTKTGAHQFQVSQALNHLCLSGNEPNCDFIYMLGDLIYPEGVVSVWDSSFEYLFENIYKRFGDLIFFGIPGNHEYYGLPEADVEYSYFSQRWYMPALHYGVPALPEWLNIYGIDTSGIMGLGGTSTANTQTAALETEFCEKPGWKILAGHHPVYGSGKHGFEPKMNTYLNTLYKNCPFDLYLSGHEHLQEHVRGDLFDSIIQGAGGAALYKLKKLASPIRFLAESSTPARFEQMFGKSAHGFAILEATEEKIDVYFYDIAMWNYNLLTQDFSEVPSRQDYIYHCTMTKGQKRCK